MAVSGPEVGRSGSVSTGCSPERRSRRCDKNVRVRIVQGGPQIGGRRGVRQPSQRLDQYGADVRIGRTKRFAEQRDRASRHLRDRRNRHSRAAGLTRQLDERRWQYLVRAGQQQSEALGYTEDDVERLIEESRADRRERPR